MKGMLQMFAVVLLLSAAGWGPGCAGEAGSGAEATTETVAGEQPAVQEVAAARLDEDGGSVEQRLRDLSTAARVRKALVNERSLRAFDFEPVVTTGHVVLRGEVQTASQRDRAAAIARGIEGVRAVVNEVVAVQAPQAADPPPVIAESAPPEASPDPTSRDREEAPQEPDSETAPEQAPPAASQEQAPQTQATHHTVRSGESLWTISRRYDVTVDQIKRLNNLGSNALQPGQKLRVK